MKSLLTSICLSLTLILGICGLAGATLLTDNGKWYDSHFQEFAFAPGSYTLEFDYQIQSLGSAGTGSFNDLFTASIYFADAQGLIDPLNNVFPNPGDALSLFSIDNVTNTGVQHFSMNFSNNYAYVIPTFELFDFNFVDNDSAVYIDNVTIESAPIPEPTTLLLLGGGLLGLFGMRRLRSRGNV